MYRRLAVVPAARHGEAIRQRLAAHRALAFSLSSSSTSAAAAAVSVTVPAAASDRASPSVGKTVKRTYTSSARRQRQHQEYYKHRKKKETGPDPFAVLGFSRPPPLSSSQSSSSASPSTSRDHVEGEVDDNHDDNAILYATVKAAFLQIAMRHHPDTSTASTPEEEERHKEVFMAARAAFEQITEGPQGRAILRSESDKAWQEEELNTWFQEQTGLDMPFMDVQTMKEVAEMTEKIGGGLDRDGGMWQLARLVSNKVKHGGDARDVLQLEAGDVRNIEGGGLRRRRRR